MDGAGLSGVACGKPKIKGKCSSPDSGNSPSDTGETLAADCLTDRQARLTSINKPLKVTGEMAMYAPTIFLGNYPLTSRQESGNFNES